MTVKQLCAVAQAGWVAAVSQVAALVGELEQSTEEQSRDQPLSIVCTVCLVPSTEEERDGDGNGYWMGDTSDIC
jgi:hypothetical protein